MVRKWLYIYVCMYALDMVWSILTERHLLQVFIGNGLLAMVACILLPSLTYVSSKSVAFF